MSLLHGKQLRDGSISLDKIQGHSGLVTFTASATMSFQNGAILRRDTADIIVSTDVVNKEYVDSVASGLNPKATSRVIYTGDITSISGYTYSNGSSGVGATLTFTTLTSIDGVSLNNGDRVIFNSTTDQFANGIYVYGSTASFFTRANDFDGVPEIDGGEYSFVIEGTSYADTGWVVSSPNSTATIGVTPIVWVQFSSAGVITAGDGLYQLGNSFNIGSGTGITVSANAIAISNTTVSAGSYGGSSQAVTFTVNAQGQLTAASTQSISINSNQVANFNTSVSNEVFDAGNFVDGSTIDFVVTTGSSVTAEVINGSLTASKLNSNGQGATAGYILSANSDGTFAWILNDAGDITSVVAGIGLSGGGSVGDVTLDINTGNGLSINSDSVVLGGTLSQNTIINGGGYDFTLSNADYIMMTGSSFDVESDFISIDAGTGSMQLIGTDVTISGDNVDILGTFSINSVVIDPVGALTGLALIYDGSKFKPSVIAGGISGVTAGAGLSGGGTSGFVQLDVELTTNGGLTFSGVGDSSTLQLDYTSVANQLDGAGLVANGTTLDVSLGINSGLTFSGDSVIIDTSVAGSGLTFSGGIVNVETTIDKGLTFSSSGANGTLEVGLKVNGGLTFSQGQISALVDGTTINVFNGALRAISAQPIYQSHLTPSATLANTNFQTTGLSLFVTPNDNSRISIYVNGQYQYLGNGVNATASGVDCYFSSDGGLTAKNLSALVSGDVLYWNGNVANAGFKLDSNDRIDIVYEA